jgi:hypothetical protein
MRKKLTPLKTVADNSQEKSDQRKGHRENSVRKFYERKIVFYCRHSISRKVAKKRKEAKLPQYFLPIL